MVNIDQTFDPEAKWVTQEGGEWECLVLDIHYLGHLMQRATEAGKDRLVNHLLTQEGEWERLVVRAVWLKYLMQRATEAGKDRLVEHFLTTKGEWARLVASADDFKDIYMSAQHHDKLKILLLGRLCAHRDFYGMNLDGIKEMVTEGLFPEAQERDITAGLLEVQTIEDFVKEVGERQAFLAIRKYARQMGCVYRYRPESTEACHIAMLPPELLAKISVFAGGGGSKHHKMALRLMGKPVKSEEASGSAPAATM